jgi:membrane fusion protein, multidrug efflux system
VSDRRDTFIKGPLKNNLTFWKPIHPVRLCGENEGVSRYASSFHALPNRRLNSQNCELIFERTLREKMKKPDLKTRSLRVLWSMGPWLIVIFFILIIFNMGVLVKGKQKDLELARKEAMVKTAPPVKVVTLAIESRRMKDQISLPGEVMPFEDLKVRAEVPGRVRRILAAEGQTLKAGQVIMEIDDRDFRSRLAGIEANLKLAKLNHSRISALAKKNIVSPSKLDETEARVADLEAARDEAALAFERTRVTAPIGGRLNDVIAKSGAFVKAGDEVAAIIQFKSVKVTVGVPESDAPAIMDVDRADVVIDAVEKRRVVGKKIFFSRRPRTMSRLYDLELKVPNPDGLIFPGMFARVHITKSVFEKAVAAPLYAIIADGEQRFVYVEEDGVARKRAVETGGLIGWEAVIKSGLSPGDRVIIVGHRMVEDGRAVDVVRHVDDAREVLGS